MSPELHSRINGAVITRITGLNLEYVKRVADQLYPDIRSFTDGQLPGVSVSCENESESRTGLDNEGFECWYPVRVALLDKAGDSPEAHARKDIYLKTRKSMMDAFETPKDGVYRLEGIPEVKRCVIQPDFIFDRRLPNYMHVVSGFVLRFWAVEMRV